MSAKPLRFLLGLTFFMLSYISTHAAAAPQAEFVLIGMWGDRYCGEIQVSTSQQEVFQWQVLANVQGTVTQVWNGTYEPIDTKTHNAVFTPTESYTIIPIGGSVSIGVCGTGKPPQDLVVISEAGDASDGKDLSIDVLAEGAYGNVTQPQYLVVQTREELKELESRLGMQLNVDTEKSTVIAVFMGQRNTGGYSIQVAEATATNGNVNVLVEQVSPGPGCAVTMALTNPFQIVAVPKQDKPFTFQEKHTVRRCDYQLNL